MEINHVKDKLRFTWDGFVEGFYNVAPDLMVALSMLLIGLVVAFVVKKLTFRILKKLKLDCAADRIGLSGKLKAISIKQTPSMLVAMLFFWLILFFSFITTADYIGLTGFSEALTRIALYIPSVMAAIVILVVGFLIAHFARIATKSALMHIIPSVSRLIANFVYGLFAVVIVLTAIEQLSIDTYLIQMVVLISFGAFAVAITLSAGLGSRHQVQKLLAGYYLKDQININQTITFAGTTGKVLAFNADSVVIETEAGKMVIPNDQLQDSVLLIHPVTK